MATQKKKTEKKTSKSEKKVADDNLGFSLVLGGWFLIVVGVVLLLGCISSVYSGASGNWLGPYLGAMIPGAIMLLFGKVAVIFFTFALVLWGVTIAFDGLRGKLFRYALGLSLLSFDLCFLMSLKNYGVAQVSKDVLLMNGGMLGQFFSQNLAVPLFGRESCIAPLLILVAGFGLILVLSFGLRPRHFGFVVKATDWLKSRFAGFRNKKQELYAEKVEEYEPVKMRRGVTMDDNTVLLEPDAFKIRRKGKVTPFNGRNNWLDEVVQTFPSPEPETEETLPKAAIPVEKPVEQTISKAKPSYDGDYDPEIIRLQEYLRLNEHKMNALEIVEVREKIAALRRARDLIKWEKGHTGPMQVKGDVRRNKETVQEKSIAETIAAGALDPVEDEPTMPAEFVSSVTENIPEIPDETFLPEVHAADETMVDSSIYGNDEVADDDFGIDELSAGGTNAHGATIPQRDPTEIYDEYKIPSIDEILDTHEVQTADYTEAELNEIGRMLEEKLENFKVKGRVIGCETGPMITRFEVEPGPGMKVSRFSALQEDLALPLKVSSVRILAPIPGKAAVGIEIPNRKFQTVYSLDVFQSEKFSPTPEKIQVALGKDITGEAFTMDLAKAPHLLIAGQTGSGKSVCINALMASILFSKTPDELRMILVDPKAVELKMYEKIPHLLAPVITKPDVAIQALQWLCFEMDRRTEVLASAKVRNIGGFNTKFEAGELPLEVPEEDRSHRMAFIVVIIDEMADLMMVAGKEIEKSVARLAAKARAVGIHLVLATQRPSVKVITGIIKANLPTRISFKVASQIDARTVMDHAGAEKLLGRGDMLYKAVNDPDPIRVHGAFLSDEEAERLADACSNQNVFYPQVESFEVSESDEDSEDGGAPKKMGKLDPLLFDVAKWAIDVNGLSTSAVQRHFSVGFSRAGKIVDQLYALGVCGPSKGNSKPRAMCIGMDELLGMERSGAFRN
ncbi:MAG: DNA translocase FtsK [Fibrobacter sp.]|nr:DNA translocase FtsK [Fibrobacter sp.]